VVEVVDDAFSAGVWRGLVKDLVDDVKREAGEWVMPHASRVACLIAIPPWTIGTRHRTLLLESKNVVDAVS